MNFSKLKFGATIGIIGGGQLGKMMAQAATSSGIRYAPTSAGRAPGE
ncbi:hypothetical protein [Micromonospora aurantiaca (nom. illeg.)]